MPTFWNNAGEEMETKGLTAVENFESAVREAKSDSAERRFGMMEMKDASKTDKRDGEDGSVERNDV